MRVVLNAGCHLWQPEVTTYANAAFVAVVEELKEIDSGLLDRVIPGYCNRLSELRSKPDGQLQSFRITATNSDTEWPRLKRLRAVLDELRLMRDEPVWKIEGLHDHKGTLTVDWREPPLPNDLRAVEYVWCSSVANESDNIEHRFMGQDVREIMT